MKKLFYFIFALMLVSNIFAQKVVDGFDSQPTDPNYWKILNGEIAQGDIMNISYVTSPKYAGTGAFKVDFKTQGYFSWGNFVGLEQWCPDSTGYYDLSGYDSLTFRYYVDKPVDPTINMVFRLCLLDASDAATGAKTYVQTACEKYFSFLYILKETTPGWHYVAIPLVNNDNTEGNGFAQRSWGGMQWGNSKLDLDMIKGFVWEFVVDENSTKVGQGTVIFDQLELHGVQSKAIIFFNGKAIPSTINFSQGRAGSCVVTNEQTSNPITHMYSLKWTTPGQWDGPIWELKKPISLMDQWAIDTVKFKIKAPAGIGDLRLIFQDVDTDGAAKADYPFEAAYILKADDMKYDGTWKTVQIPLRKFDKKAGVWDDATSAQVDGVFDSTKVWRFKIFRTNDARWQNQIVYLDEVWTGSPVFDVMPPTPPENISAVTSSKYVNTIIWTDSPFEQGETYDIYSSTKPITDVTSKEVDHIGNKIEENVQNFDHVLIAPGKDQSVTYYYAIVCNDAAGNVSTIATSAQVTNTAKGVAVIKETAPANFKADGLSTEWTNVTPTIVSKAAGTTHIPDGLGYVLSGDADFSFQTYLAVDSQNLYVFVDVNDDILYEDPTNNLDLSYLYDGVDVFLGLYDWRGESHVALQTGAQTDCHFRLNKWGVILDQSGGGQVLDDKSSDFKFVEKFPSGYTMEAKIPFAKIASMLSPGNVFVPKVGMRIPFDMIGNDNDGTPPNMTRECVLTYSAKSNDQSYRDVSVWTNTWIGEQWTTPVEKEDESIVYDYKLSQNYPNPFNPSTTINYAVKALGNVTLKIYDVLGREVKTLVNEQQVAGNHQVKFDASNLPSGIYFCHMISNNYSQTIKMMLLK